MAPRHRPLSTMSLGSPRRKLVNGWRTVPGPSFSCPRRRQRNKPRTCLTIRDAQVVLDRNTLPMHERFLPFTKAVTDNDDNSLLPITDFPAFARSFLQWPDDCLHGLDP